MKSTLICLAVALSGCALYRPQPEYLTVGGMTVPVYPGAVSGQQFVVLPDDCTVGASASQCAADLQQQLLETRRELDEARAMEDLEP